MIQIDIDADLNTEDRSANSPQEVRARPILADDVQRSRERVAAGQTVHSGCNRRRPTTTETPRDRSASRSEAAGETLDVGAFGHILPTSPRRTSPARVVAQLGCGPPPRATGGCRCPAWWLPWRAPGRAARLPRRSSRQSARRQSSGEGRAADTRSTQSRTAARKTEGTLTTRVVMAPGASGLRRAPAQAHEEDVTYSDRIAAVPAGRRVRGLSRRQALRGGQAAAGLRVRGFPAAARERERGSRRGIRVLPPLRAPC